MLFINNEFTGSFGVETTLDDDIIGFVFGYNSLDDFYLFDWKQNHQIFNGAEANAGFTLSKISTGADSSSGVPLWTHVGQGITVLDTDYGNGRGWMDNVIYDFTLGYTNTEINIYIDGGAFINEQIFSIANLTNTAGSFGFYNQSQPNVRYRVFAEETCNSNCGIVDVTEPSTIVILGLGLMGLASRRFKRKS